MEPVNLKLKAMWSGFLGLLAMACVLAPPAAAQSAPSTPPALSERAKKGKALFADNCFVCHDRDSDRVKRIGPSLDGLFTRKTLIVGKPVTEANVRDVIKTGPTPGMPGFRYKLSDEEISDIVEFLKTK